MLMIFFQAAAVGTQAAAVGAAVGPLASGWEPNSPRWGFIPKMGEKFVLNRLKSFNIDLYIVFFVFFQVAFIFSLECVASCRLSCASTGLAQAGMLVGGLGLEDNVDGAFWETNSREDYRKDQKR